MLLPVLDNIVNNLFSDVVVFCRDLKCRLGKELNIELHNSSMKAPVNNPSLIAKYFKLFKRCVDDIDTSPTNPILFPESAENETKY